MKSLLLFLVVSFCICACPPIVAQVAPHKPATQQVMPKTDPGSNVAGAGLLSLFSSAVVAAVVTGIGLIFNGWLNSRRDMKTRELEHDFNERIKRMELDFNERMKSMEIEAHDRTSRSDLYRTVYPERFKASQELMQEATSLYRNVISIMLSGVHDEEDLEFLKVTNQQAHKVHALGTGARWLLGPEVQRMTEDLSNKSMIILHWSRNNRFEELEEYLPTPNPTKSNKGQYEELFLQLCQLVRTQLHLATLEALIPNVDSGSIAISEGQNSQETHNEPPKPAGGQQAGTGNPAGL